MSRIKQIIIIREDCNFKIRLLNISVSFVHLTRFYPIRLKMEIIFACYIKYYVRFDADINNTSFKKLINTILNVKLIWVIICATQISCPHLEICKCRVCLSCDVMLWWVMTSISMCVCVVQSAHRSGVWSLNARSASAGVHCFLNKALLNQGHCVNHNVRLLA